MTHQLTQEQIDDLKASFDMFDKDGSGNISHSELKSVMRRFGQNLSDSEVRDMIRSVDIDRNNEIDFKEFVHLMKSRISNDPDYELKLAFQMIDSDSSGTISIDELRALMRKVNQHLTE
mmetsp:Transcript_19156/g.24139  ORF Transcript_19156/g.24139 Transcript_19156/m.24139 type:complete len:119 (+) Transcript_19156:75-431(+)